MSNSIDEMFNNQIPNKKKKSGLKVFILFIIFLMIIGGCAVGVWMYLQKQDKPTSKDDFLKILGKSKFSNVLNYEKISTLTDRIQKDDSEATTEISGTVSAGLIESELDLSEMKLQVDSKTKPVEKKNASEIFLTYKGNEIISLNSLLDSEKIGIFSKDIIVKYIGSKYSNLSSVLKKISNENGSIDFELPQLQDFNIVLPQFSDEMILKYIDVIKQNVPDACFSSKSIILDRNSENLEVVQYSMSLTESQAIELVDQMLQVLENDEELLDILLASFGENALEYKEQIKSAIEIYINSLYEKTPDDSKKYTLNVYGANNVVYKVSLDFYGEYTIDVDFNYNNNENSMTVNILQTESQSGYSIDILKTISDVSEKLDITVNKVEESEIVGKINFICDLVNSRKFIYS